MTQIETKIKAECMREVADSMPWIAEAWNVAELVGSEKQVNWANSLRHGMLTEFAKFAEKNNANGQIAKYRELMHRIAETETSAKFYIDNQKDFRAALKSAR